MMLFYHTWSCKVLCFTDVKLWTQRYVCVDFSFGLHCKNKERGDCQNRAPFPEKTSRIFPVNGLGSISWAVPRGCCKSFTQQAWDVQTLHIPKKRLTLDWLLRDNLWDSGIFYLTRMSLFTCGLELHQCDLWWGPWTMWYQFDLWWSQRLSNEGQPQGSSMPMWLPVKPWSLKLGELPCSAILYMCYHISFLEDWSAVCVTPWGEDNWKFVPGLCWF